MKELESNHYLMVTGGESCVTDAAAAAGAALGTVGACASGVATAGCIGAAIGTAAAAVSANASCTAATAAPAGTVSCTADTDAMGNPTGTSTCSDSGGGGGGGGKVICTELCRNGVIDHAVWMADIRYSQQNFSAQTMRGYHLWGVPYVRLMRKSPLFAKLAAYPTRWFAEDIAFRMGVLSTPNYRGLVLREFVFRPVCFALGLFAKARDWLLGGNTIVRVGLAILRAVASGASPPTSQASTSSPITRAKAAVGNCAKAGAHTNQ